MQDRSQNTVTAIMAATSMAFCYSSSLLPAILPHGGWRANDKPLYIESHMVQEPLSITEEDTRNFLLSLPIFDSFNTDELTMLAKHMSYVHLQRGEYLFMEGDKGNFMGFVVQGLLEVIKRSDTGQNIVIARLTKGNSIGEMALIDKSPRSATVVAKQPTTMVTLTDKGFDLLTERSPILGVKVIQKVARLLSLYMRRTSSRLADLMQNGLEE